MSTDLNWESLAEEFRALGGTAENVTARKGPRGRALFPIDPAKPVRLSVPPNLLIPTQDLELRDGALVIKASTLLGEGERKFFERYQRDLCWGAGVFDDLWQAQLEWSQLPQEVENTLREIGWIVNITTRFSEPSEDLCLRQYVTTRETSFRGASVLMPMLELVNHGDEAVGFEHGDGIAVSGVFAGEVLVSYNPDDCWGRVLYHGFFEPTDHALSLGFSCVFEDIRIEVHHECRLEQFNGVGLPIVRIERDDTIDFSFLMLGHVKYPRLPRAVFHHVAKNLPIKRPDELFDLIQHYNRMQLLKFLRASEGVATSLVTVLRGAAYQQLATLSNHWGTGPLGAG